LKQKAEAEMLVPGPTLADLLSGCRASGSKSLNSDNMDKHLRLRVEFQWFFIALSVLPESKRAMVAHLFPNLAWALIMVSSSSGVNARCSTCGESWLHQRSLQDFPERPGIDLLIKDQFLGPCFSRSLCNNSSSSGLQGPLIRSVSFVSPVAAIKRKHQKIKLNKT
jgi:hypothetical protein